MTDCRFQCRCRSLGCLQLQRHSQKPFPAPPPDFQYPMNSSHYYSRYRKYFLHFGSLSPFLNFLFLTKPLSIPNSLSPSRNVFSAWGLVTSLLWGSNTYSTSSAMFVTDIVRLFRSNCPLRVQERMSLHAAILCSKSEARFSGTARERWLQTSFILCSSSSISSPENSLSSCSLSCSSSTKSFSSFWWVPLTDLASSDQLAVASPLL